MNCHPLNKSIVTTLFIVLVVVMITGCEDNTAQKRDIDAREMLMERASTMVPVPKTNNFTKRKAVQEYVKRMDEPNKTFYIYVVSDMGNYIGYYVSRGGPVNMCNFMTPPDRVDSSYNSGNVVRNAPGVDGLYYGGSGACDTEYFFDAETDALIQIKGNNLVVSDQPLELDVQAITVKQE